ncbi:DUF6525 family protein [Phaeobacter sp. NW0010-22]
MPRNVQSSLRRRRAAPMSRFDKLHPDLRRWLQRAMLSWSVKSAERIWAKALRQNHGNVQAALSELDRLERALMFRDIERIWGPDHPGLIDGPARRTAA